MERTMAVDLDKMADRVAEKALDEFTYNGKTIREWVELIVSQDSLAVAELEKIKAEIGDKFVDLQDGTEEWRSVWNDAIEECYRSLDKHISEMKGEAK